MVLPAASGPPVKVLVVDDSVLMQKLMTKIIDGAPGFQVIGVAGSAEEGWDAIQDLRPDVVTLDLELPGRVVQIRPIGENKQGDITYTAIVQPDQLDERLRWNMTASVAIRQPLP